MLESVTVSLCDGSMLKGRGQDYPWKVLCLCLCLPGNPFSSWQYWGGWLALPELWSQPGEQGVSWRAKCLFLGQGGRLVVVAALSHFSQMMDWSDLWNIPHLPVRFRADWVLSCAWLWLPRLCSHSSLHTQTKKNQNPLENLTLQPFRIWMIWRVSFPYLWLIRGFICATPCSHQFKMQKSAPFFYHFILLCLWRSPLKSYCNTQSAFFPVFRSMDTLQ